MSSAGALTVIVAEAKCLVKRRRLPLWERWWRGSTPSTCTRGCTASASSTRLPGLSRFTTMKKKLWRWYGCYLTPTVQEIKKFAEKQMGTKDVRIDTRLNKAIWAQVNNCIQLCWQLLFMSRNNAFLGCQRCPLPHARPPGEAEERGRGLRAQALHPRHLRQYPQGWLQGPSNGECWDGRVKCVRCLLLSEKVGTANKWKLSILKRSWEGKFSWASLALNFSEFGCMHHFGPAQCTCVHWQHFGLSRLFVLLPLLTQCSTITSVGRLVPT